VLDWLSPDETEGCVAGPAVAEAVNETGDPVAPAADAVAACAPAVRPSVQLVVAMPSEPVVDVAGATDAPVPAAAQVTLMPCCGAPSRVTTTLNGAESVVPTVPVWLSPLAVAAFWMVGWDMPVGPPSDPPQCENTAMTPTAHRNRTNLEAMGTVRGMG